MARLGIQLRGTSRLLKGVESGTTKLVGGAVRPIKKFSEGVKDGTKEVIRSQHGIGGLIVKKAAKLFKKKDGLSVDEKLKMVKSGDLDKATGQPKTMDLLEKPESIVEKGFGSKESRLGKVFKRGTELLANESEKYKRLKKISPTIKSVEPNVPKTNLQKIISKHKIEMSKIKGQVSNEYKPQREKLDKEMIKVKQDRQKLRGEKVTKSGISKGKDKKK